MNVRTTHFVAIFQLCAAFGLGQQSEAITIYLDSGSSDVYYSFANNIIVDTETWVGDSNGYTFAMERFNQHTNDSLGMVDAVSTMTMHEYDFGNNGKLFHYYWDLQTDDGFKVGGHGHYTMYEILKHGDFVPTTYKTWDGLMDRGPHNAYMGDTALNGLGFDNLSYAQRNIQWRFIAPIQIIPGDTNGDGVVNGSDLSVLLGNWLAEVAGGSADGDFNLSGTVDGSDLSVLLGNWLQPMNTQSHTLIPEPSSLFALLVGMLTWAAFPGRSTRHLT